MMSDGDIKVYDKEAKCEMMGMSLSLEHQKPTCVCEHCGCGWIHILVFIIFNGKNPN